MNGTSTKISPSQLEIISLKPKCHVESSGRRKGGVKGGAVEEVSMPHKHLGSAGVDGGRLAEPLAAHAGRSQRAIANRLEEGDSMPELQCGPV